MTPRQRSLLVTLAAAFAVSAAPTPAQRASSRVTNTSEAPARVAAFREGFEASVDGGEWRRVAAVNLDSKRCPRSTTSPCAAGTPLVAVKIRFPSLDGALDLSRVLPQLGESAAAGWHYDIRPVPMNARGAVCSGGFRVASPFNDMHLAITLDAPGHQLPIECQWTVLAGIPNTNVPGGVQLVWSDTIHVHIARK